MNRKFRNPVDRLEWLIAVSLTPGITSAAKAVAAALLKCLNTGSGLCNPGMAFLRDKTGLHIASIKRALALLEKYGLLVVIERGGGIDPDSRKTNKYGLRTPMTGSTGATGSTDDTGSTDAYGPVAAVHTTGSRDAPQNSVNNSVNRTQRETRTRATPPPPEDDPTPRQDGQAQLTDTAKAVVALLNRLAGTQYRYSEKTLKPLLARLREGFTETELRQVTAFKVDRWKDDPKMFRYLRPETLYGSKFESYLNEMLMNAQRDDAPEKPKPRTGSFTEARDDEPNMVMGIAFPGPARRLER